MENAVITFTLVTYLLVYLPTFLQRFTPKNKLEVRRNLTLILLIFGIVVKEFGVNLKSLVKRIFFLTTQTR